MGPRGRDQVSNESEKRQRRRQVRNWWQLLDRDLPADITPLEAIVSIEALDADGNLVLVNKRTRGLSPWKAWGMLQYAIEDFTAADQEEAATGDDE